MVQTPASPETETLLIELPKMREYIDNGAKLGRLIDPQQRRVEIYQLGKDVDVLENPAQLSGEAVLPGFVLNLGRVWD